MMSTTRTNGPLVCLVSAISAPLRDILQNRRYHAEPQSTQRESESPSMQTNPLDKLPFFAVTTLLLPFIWAAGAGENDWFNAWHNADKWQGQTDNEEAHLLRDGTVHMGRRLWRMRVRGRPIERFERIYLSPLR